ncbi:MAG: HAD family phosphatase [Bacteroidaceae bacterium]|nr:HAD family phosphatase [Bacteroidaceae bacterium]
MIRNIIFDFGGVICDLYPQRCRDNFMRLGCQFDIFPTQYSQFSGVFKQIDRGEITTEEFYDAIREQGKVYSATNEMIREAWLSVLGDIPQERFEALSALRKKYSLYILSNANDLHWEYLSKECLDYRGENTVEWFKQIFLSYKMHLEKPEPEIYRAVLQQAGIKADESLFIDDNQLNLDVAAKEGIHTMLSTGGDWIGRLESEYGISFKD